MIISRRKKFIFIHNPKTGGSSITSSFNKYGYLLSRFPDRVQNYSRLVLDESWQLGLFRKHIPAFDLKTKVPPNVWNSYFKFGFVRNPYDRIISLFNYVRQTPDHLEFQEFIRHKDINGYLDQIMKVDLTTEPWHCQSYYLTDKEGNILVDYVGKFENLNSDFEKINSILHLTDPQLKHLNKSQRERDISKVLDKESIQKVNHIYRRDFENFRYEMY